MYTTLIMGSGFSHEELKEIQLSFIETKKNETLQIYVNYCSYAAYGLMTTASLIFIYKIVNVLTV